MRQLFLDYEARRMLILGCIYAGVLLLGYFRVIRPRTQGLAELALAATLLLLGWLQSFPAWSHSGQIGFYILLGALMLVVASRHAVRSAMTA